jgi:hypothetical protein
LDNDTNGHENNLVLVHIVGNVNDKSDAVLTGALSDEKASERIVKEKVTLVKENKGPVKNKGCSNTGCEKAKERTVT